MALRPPPSLAWLTSLKATQLKALATAIGLPSSGTKPVLTARLLASLPVSKLYRPDHAPNDTNPTPRILSIDMGIRNLAYCQLALPLRWPAAANHAPRSALPIVEAWDRIAVAPRPSPAPSSDAPSTAPAKEPFDPTTYAPHALSLLSSLVLSAAPSPPTTILIERQRFRSLGSSSVQEWTLRVNMFEAMLHAVLHTMRTHHLWEGAVYAVEPGRVQAFWLADGDKKSGGVEGGGAVKGARKAKQGKEEKIRLVGRWLEGGGVVALEGRAEETGRGFVRRGKGGVGKKDDLADCLVQGMAWVRWEENRRRIVEEGMGFVEGLG
ncbi:hypothetical protein MMC11_002258 [Xylographa trunciseda]|nr:hypothetical protein [Xylographa trunciseda]